MKKIIGSDSVKISRFLDCFARLAMTPSPSLRASVGGVAIQVPSLVKRIVITIFMVAGCNTVVCGSDDADVKACKEARGQGTKEEQQKRENECLKEHVQKECKKEPDGRRKRACELELFQQAKTLAAEL
jgi:hypothetical protein